MSVINSYEEFYAPSRKEWRKWLMKNFAKAPGVWLVYYKKASSKQSITYNDAVEEALCFGWIDSTMRPVDTESYKQLFTPRKPKSEWSQLNKTRVERMIEQGLMMPAGLEKIEVSKQNGGWEKIDHVEAQQLPDDLATALEKDKKATTFYESLTKTNKKYLLHWLGSAKREETRAKRIAEIIAALSEGLMPARFR